MCKLIRCHYSSDSAQRRYVGRDPSADPQQGDVRSFPSALHAAVATTQLSHARNAEDGERDGGGAGGAALPACCKYSETTRLYTKLKDIVRK